VQLLFAGSELGQLFVSRKSADAVMPLSVTAPDPLLVSTAAWLSEVSPTAVVANVNDAGERVKFTAAATAVPESISCCEPEGYVTVTDPVLAPVVDGANPTSTVQLLFAASVAGQLFVCKKSVVAVMLLNETDDDPLFVSSADWLGDVFPIAVLAKVSDVGVKTRFTTGATAVPESANCSEPDGYVTVIDPVLAPVAEGANLTLILQLLFAGRVAGQSLVCVKSADAAMLLTVTDADP